ncbi:Retrotransposon protein [Nesidiocoris tenuis]|uniref:Retrotransposon protein n=1 Tax=Nesidiocoris tenuis TaxID=355587 RepID=A0ABN7AG27_9HEMI|nr:Retrotransposon protein [Nesidiocoris tenuis]
MMSKEQLDVALMVILFDSRLTMTDHINRISARAMKTLGFLKRNTRDFRDIPALVTLCRSLVVPTLEYGSVVWSPFYAAHIHQLERVQHKFLRYVAYKLRIPGENVNYQELMGLCGLRTLEARRAWADLAFFSRLVGGALDCPRLVEQVSLLVPQFHTRHNHLFRVEFSPTNYMYHRPLSLARPTVSLRAILEWTFSAPRWLP